MKKTGYTKKATGRFFAGTSGLVLPVPNKQAFPKEYRDKSRLSYYASLFNSIEVNSSFYKIPMAVTVKKWALSVPDDFRFTFKLFKGVTHNKALVFDDTLVGRFMQVIDSAGNKKGSLLVQFPAGTVYNLPQLTKLLACLQKHNTGQCWQVCVEFRHNSWYRQETYTILSSCDAGMVYHDMPASATPAVTPWTNFMYLRYHGPAGDYRGGYTNAFLRRQAAMAHTWLTEGNTVYAYFNNTIGDAVKNVAAMKRYVVK